MDSSICNLSFPTKLSIDASQLKHIYTLLEKNFIYKNSFTVKAGTTQMCCLIVENTLMTPLGAAMETNSP